MSQLLSEGEKSFDELYAGTGIGRNQPYGMLKVKEHLGRIASRSVMKGKKLYSLIPF